MKSLDAARDAIRQEDWANALEALLLAWRDNRQPRIADLIDRVGERLPHEPIKAKTIKERTALWIAAAQPLDHVTLGRLLATPWPGRWQDALTLVKNLDMFRDDPRIAVAVAGFLATNPFDSYLESVDFFRAATSVVARHYDVRARAILAADLEEPHSHFWPHRDGPLVRAAVERMNERPPAALTAEEDAAIAAVESLFASDVKAEASQEKTDTDFLAAIYAAPTDDVPRAVYADWLTEQGNPRGEFIALQLAPNPTDKAKKREAAHLKEHSAEWTGAFEPLIPNHARVFRRGFLAGGTFVNAVQQPTIADLARPEWALFEKVDFNHGVMRQLIDDVLGRPWLRTLRGLTGLDEESAVRIAGQRAAPQLEELGIALPRRDLTDEIVEGRKAIAEGFPNVKALSVHAEEEDLARFLLGPLPPLLERLAVRDNRVPLPAVARMLEKHVPGVTVVESIVWNYRTNDDWHFELRRDDAGSFTRLRAEAGSPSKRLPSERELAALVASLPDLTELVVARGGGCKWNADELAHIEETLAKAKALRTIDVPWDRAVGEPANEEGEALDLILYRPGDLARAIDAAWEAMATLPLAFDSMSVNDGAHKALSRKGPEDVKTAFTKKRTRKVRVYAKRSPATVQASFESWCFNLTVPRPSELEPWLAWLTTLVERTEAKGVEVPFAGSPDRRFGPRNERLYWVWGVGPLYAQFYDFDELEAAIVETIPRARVIRTAHVRLFILGDGPEDIPSDEQHAALHARVKTRALSLDSRTPVH